MQKRTPAKNAGREKAERYFCQRSELNWFYHTKQWKQTRDAYYKKTVFCERCKRAGIVEPGKIVHHKKHLTPQNVNNPSVAFSFANLELLCRRCHNDLHLHGKEKNYTFDENGDFVPNKNDG